MSNEFDNRQGSAVSPAPSTTPKVATRYLEGQGSAYHRGGPRQRVLDARRRAIKSEYMQLILAPWLPRDADKIIEFGAGFGQNLLNLPATIKVAYEPSEYARRIASEYREIEVVASLDGFEERGFDVVLANHSLEHTLEPHNVLLQLRKLLRPGGVFLCIVPYERDHAWSEADMNAHLYSWTRMSLGNLFVESGFKVEATSAIYRSLEFRLSAVRYVSSSLWLRLSKIAGFFLRRKDILVKAIRAD